MASIRRAALHPGSSRRFHNNSSLCARVGELPSLLLATLLPMLLTSSGTLAITHPLLSCLLAFQAGLCGWVSAALMGYAGAIVLREVAVCPLPRWVVLQVMQVAAYGVGAIVGWQATRL
jgi:hypothetical protein